MIVEVHAGPACDVPGCIVRDLEPLLSQLRLDCITCAELYEDARGCCDANGEDLRYA
jgi:hypothetical protein